MIKKIIFFRPKPLIFFSECAIKHSKIAGFGEIKEEKKANDRMDDVIGDKKRQFTDLGGCLNSAVEFQSSTSTKKINFPVENFSKRYIILITKIMGLRCFNES